MAGGIWTSQNKRRPGAYLNVRSENMSAGAEGVAGVVALPVVLESGLEKQVITVDGSTNFEKVLGHNLNDPEMSLVGEALKGASTILLYRVNQGTKATATLSEGVNATALYGGTKGNSISIVVQPNLNDQSKFDVITYLGSTIVDEQDQVETAEDLTSNSFVTFSGEGNLETTAGVVLTGGNSQAPTSGDYADFFAAISKYDFNILAVPVEQEETKIAGANFVKALRNEEGKYCQAVVFNYRANNEAVINVKNRYVAEGDVRKSAAETVAAIAGLQAGASYNESLTYAEIPGAVDVFPRYTHTETATALDRGELVLTLDKDRVVVEQDINSLTTFTPEKNQDFRKNRILRTLDHFCNDTREVFNRNFIGAVANDADGRTLFLSNRIGKLTEMQDVRAITNFVAEDVVVLPGDDKDAIVVDFAMQPVDSMEKMYGTVKVK